MPHKTPKKGGAFLRICLRDKCPIKHLKQSGGNKRENFILEIFAVPPAAKSRYVIIIILRL
jgi:hypothetical protein